MREMSECRRFDTAIFVVDGKMAKIVVANSSTQGQGQDQARGHAPKNKEGVAIIGWRIWGSRGICRLCLSRRTVAAAAAFARGCRLLLLLAVAEPPGPDAGHPAMGSPLGVQQAGTFLLEGIVDGGRLFRRQVAEGVAAPIAIGGRRSRLVPEVLLAPADQAPRGGCILS
jgi:hypothetical protein